MKTLFENHFDDTLLYDYEKKCDIINGWFANVMFVEKKEKQEHIIYWNEK